MFNVYHERKGEKTMEIFKGQQDGNHDRYAPVSIKRLGLQREGELPLYPDQELIYFATR